MITWEDTTHELRPVIAHGVRKEDDIVTEWLLAECLVRDRGRGGPVLLGPARGCPCHEVTLEVSLTLVQAHNLGIREGPAIMIWEGKKLNSELDQGSIRLSPPSSIWIWIDIGHLHLHWICLSCQLPLGTNRVFELIGTWLGLALGVLGLGNRN